MLISQKGVELIKAFESCRLKAYKDAKGVWTIGWGNTFYENGTKVKKDDVITQAKANALFGSVVAGFVVDVNKLVEGVTLLQHQFDALVSFAYNVGSDIDDDKITEGLGDSTLLKVIRANPNNFSQIKAEFLKWNKAGGKTVFGLTHRRRAEAWLYITGDINLFN